MSSARRYLDVLDRVAEAHANAKSAKSAPRTNPEAAMYVRAKEAEAHASASKGNSAPLNFWPNMTPR